MLILHVLAAATLVGGELLLFFAVTPATWIIEDERLRRTITRVVAQRFARLTVGALVVLLVSGLYLLTSYVPENVRDSMADYRFGGLFVTKMIVVAVLLVVIGVHGMYYGPRIARASEAVIDDGGNESARRDLDNLRRRSFQFSIMMVAVTLAALGLGVVLGNHDYSYVAN